MFDLGPRSRVTVGEFTLMNGTRIICDSEISIGDHCLISWNTVLMDSRRLSFDPGARRRVLQEAARQRLRPGDPDVEAQPIRIANQVWIGFDSCILPGVSIGEGSVVGARSVVVENVPPFTIVAGNPARVIRKLVGPDCKET
jgi:acetyltransferase-like isoleucine patch superfamily enzyme